MQDAIYYHKARHITNKLDLLVENNPLLSSKKFIEYTYNMCNQDFEDKIESGVVCATLEDTVEHLTKADSVIGMWWIEQIIIANPEYVGASALNPQEN